MPEEPESADTNPDFVAYAEQVILVGSDWSDTRGYTSKFMFTDKDTGGHPLEGFNKGARFQMVLVEVADDEEPINQRLKKKLMKQLDDQNKGGRWSNDCGMLCKSTDYQRYLFTIGKISGQWDEKTRVAMAREHILEMLKIKSRREIDHSESSVAAYANLILDPYHEWERTRTKK